LAQRILAQKNQSQLESNSWCSHLA
jgi:hypothetical protein